MAIINAGPAERRNDLNLYLTASFFALLHMVILSAKCHANQCETFRRATVTDSPQAWSDIKAVRTPPWTASPCRYLPRKITGISGCR